MQQWGLAFVAALMLITIGAEAGSRQRYDGNGDLIETTRRGPYSTIIYDQNGDISSVSRERRGFLPLLSEQRRPLSLDVPTIGTELRGGIGDNRRILFK